MGRGERQVYQEHASDVNAVVWSPDGRWIASGDDGRGVKIWQAP
jgi:WD40 repeat protein